MRLHTNLLRRIHRWIGLVIGLQFLLWAISGALKAVLDMEEVAGGPRPNIATVPVPTTDAWPLVSRQLGGTPVASLTVRQLIDRHVYEVRTKAGIQLFDVGTGVPVAIDARLAERVAGAAYPGSGKGVSAPTAHTCCRFSLVVGRST